jgi:dihydrolipoamide dehydrogenase
MDRYDFVIIGAGPAGEAAAHEARDRGASVLIVDRRWFGGSCPHIGCVPSKALLHSAAMHELEGDRYDWARASARRDYMVNRAADAAEPADSSHVVALEPGCRTLRGTGRIWSRAGVFHRLRQIEVEAGNILVAVGSTTKVLPLAGTGRRTGRTARRPSPEPPRSLLVLGGGPTGCELAQVFARFGVPTRIVNRGRGFCRPTTPAMPPRSTSGSSAMAW